MTDDDVRRRVEYWRRLIAPEWCVVLQPEPHPDRERPDADDIAHVQSSLCIQEIRMHLRPAARELSEERLDRVIVHELLHPLLDRVLDFENVWEGHLPPALWTSVIEGREATMEEFVNRTAHAIVDAHHGKLGAFSTRWLSDG